MSNISNNTTSLQEILEILQNKATGEEQATPVISVNSTNGLITATAGTKSSTHQLAFQPAKTITPTTTSQIAVSSGYYTGGNITVVGDSNLVASNIKKGASIFGVSGSYEAEGGEISLQDKTITENGTYTADSGYDGLGTVIVNVEDSGEIDYSVEDSLVTRTVTSYTNDRVTSIGDNAFNYCSSLTSVNFPACTSIGYSAFNYCSSLTSVNFPACTSIGNFAFRNCHSLTSAQFGLNILSTNVNAYIYSVAFGYCSKLTNLTLYYPSVVILFNPNAFISTPMSLSTLTGSFGSIYVPASLVDAYKSATNWVTYADRITAIVGDGDEDEVTLVSISATYSGGDVPAGTAVSSLIGITVVAEYSDGSTATITDYTLSGTIAEGTNTITITYENKTTAFTVTGITDAGGDTSLITFTLGSNSYQAEQGMTWNEWCDSVYNIDEFTYIESSIVYKPSTNQIVKFNGTNVKSSDVIIRDALYTF